MALKFSVQTDGMDAVKEAVSKGCDRAEHVLAVQVAKRYRSVRSYAHRLSEDAYKGNGEHGYLPRAVCQVFVLWQAVR